MRIVRRFTALLIVALVATAAAAPAALAGSQFMYKSSSKGAQTYWTQVDGTDLGTPFGNVHIGWLDVYETSKGKGDAFISIIDWDCLPGTLPSGGGHGEEPDPNCTHVGFRYGEGYGLSFSMNNKFDTAQLVGQLTIYGGGHGEGGVVGRPQANVTWTGVGEVFDSSSTWRYRSGGTWYSERYSSSGRNAVMSGTIGPMGFDPDLSGGWMSTFKSMSKGKSN